MNMKFKQKGLEEAGIAGLGGLVGFALKEWGMRVGLI